MHDEVHVIEQHPFGLGVPFGVRGVQSGLPESLLDLIGDGLDLPRVATRADDEIIGEAAMRLIEFERGHVGRLLFLTGANGGCHLTLQLGGLVSRFGHRPSV